MSSLSKNHTLKGGTSPYFRESPIKGPVCGPVVRDLSSERTGSFTHISSGTQRIRTSTSPDFSSVRFPRT